MSSRDVEHMKISIISSGLVWRTKVTASTKINKLITMSLSHFHCSGVNTSSKLSRCRVVLVRTRSILSGEKTVGEHQLKDNDEILLVEFAETQKQPAVDLRGPTASEIFEATKHLEMRNADKPVKNSTDIEDDMDFTDRFTKDSPLICVALVETAAHLLTFASNGMEIFKIVEREISSRKEPARHSPCTKQLTDMGFPERMVIKALTAKKMNFAKAMEWLLEQSSSSEETDYKDCKEEPSTSQSHPLTVFDAFRGLLESAIKNRNENFQANLNHVKQLKHMGFEENAIEHALRETNNNLKAAISCLKKNMSGMTSLDKSWSLDPNGSMYKSLMTSEIVQLNLKKPKFLIAIFAILESPQCLSLWLKDQEIGSILNHLMYLHSTETSGGRCIS